MSLFIIFNLVTLMIWKTKSSKLTEKSSLSIVTLKAVNFFRVKYNNYILHYLTKHSI